MSTTDIPDVDDPELPDDEPDVEQPEPEPEPEPEPAGTSA